jgi:hypothetical protein
MGGCCASVGASASAGGGGYCEDELDMAIGFVFNLIDDLSVALRPVKPWFLEIVKRRSRSPDNPELQFLWRRNNLLPLPFLWVSQNVGQLEN